MKKSQLAGAALLSLLVVLVSALAGCDKDSKEQVVVRTGPPEVSAPAAAAGSHLDKIKTAGVLRIGVKGDSPPFCFQDQESRPQGFDIDLGGRLARSLGVQPLFITVTAQERIEKLRKGEVDVVIATLTATRRRAQEIDFSMPYFQDQQGLLVKTASSIKSYRDLANHKVAALPGSTSIDNIKVVAPDCTVVEAKSLADAFAKLQSGEADAMTGDGLALRALQLNSPEAAQFQIAGEGFSVEPYVIGLPRDDSQFRTRVDDFLTELWNNGTWTRLFDKWLGSQSRYNLEAHFQMPVLPP